ncbi:MAG TPA: MFS transporter [Anaerolineales bacterium]
MVTNGSRKNTLILGFTLLVVLLGYGMVQPIIPFLITKLGASGRDLGVLTSVYATMQLVFAPFWGTLSDRIGRKPVLLIGVLGYAITMFAFGLSTRFWMLFVSRTFSGMLSSGTLPAALAYVSDNLPEKERGGAMGQLGAATGVGLVLGPLLGGLLSTGSLSLPFFVGAGLALLSVLLVYLLLPESRSAWTAAHPAQTDTFWRWNALKPILLSPAGILLLLILIVNFGLTVFQGIGGLYVLKKFNFDTRQMGALLMVVGVVMVLGQGALAGLLAKFIGEVKVIRFALLVGAFGFIALLLANGFLPILLAAGLFSLAYALANPALNSYLSAFGGEQQGGMMGLNAAFASLGRVFGPLWAGFVFDINLVYPFASSMVVLFIGFVVSLVGLRVKSIKPADEAAAFNKMLGGPDHSARVGEMVKAAPIEIPSKK